jgi:precorrin-3B methylase
LQYRRPETPVGVVTAAYRPNMCVRLTTLGELTNDGVDMETTVIVGSSQTRNVNGRMVTPRGYRERS